MRVAWFPLLVIVACAEGKSLDRGPGADSGGSAGGRSGGTNSGGGTPVLGGSKATGGASTGGKTSGGQANTGGIVTTGGTKSTTGGSVSSGGMIGAAGSSLTGGPTCRFTDGTGGIGGGGAGGADTGAGATSGAGPGGTNAGGTDTGGPGTGGDSVGGMGDAAGAVGLLAASGAPDAGGAAGSAGAGGASGVGPMQAFCDDFEDGDAGGWVAQSCDWGVTAEGDGFSFDGGPGTCQARAGAAVWVDQIVELRIKVTSFGGNSDSYRAGLVARSGGSSSYYALGLAGNGALRLLRGTSTLGGSGNCADYPASASANVWYTLRLEVTGPANSVHLRSFIDGKPAHDCTVTSSTLASGSAGVFTYGETTALFDDVRVWAP